MKKKTFIGLAACALSFGAAAGVVSTRAIETHAGTLEWIKIMYTTDGWGTNSNTVMVEETAGNFVATIDFKAKQAETVKSEFTIHYKYDDGGDTWCGDKTLTLAPSEWTVATGENVKYNGSVDKTFKITASNTGWNATLSTGTIDLKIEEVATTTYDITEYLVIDGVKESSPLPVAHVAENTDIPATNPGFGKVFGGWYTDQACTTPAGKATANATVYGKVTTAATATYHVDVSAVSDLSAPYIFAWDDNGNNGAWPGVAVPAGDITAGKFDITLPTTIGGFIVANAAGNKQTVNIAKGDLVDGTTFTIETTTDGEGKYTYSKEIVYPKFSLETIYYTNNKEWEHVYAYAWDGSTKNAEWPGVEMTFVAKNGDEQDVMKIEGMDDYSAVVFNNGLTGENERKTNDVHTTDLGVGNNAFYATGDSSPFGVGSWNYIPPAIPVLSKVAGTLAGNPLTFSASAKGGTDTWDAQFEATITGSAGDVLAFTYDSAAINPTLDTGDNNVELVSTQIKLIKAVENKKLYLKSTAGAWSLWVEGNEAAPIEDGYYLVGTHNSWAANAAGKSRVPQDAANKAEFVGVELEANAEVKIAHYVDNAAVSTDWVGFDKVTGGNDLVQEGAGGNIIVKTAGTYNFFVQNDEDKLFITKDAAPVPVLAKVAGTLGGNALTFSETTKSGTETWDAQFEATITGAAGDVLAFTYDSAAINPTLDTGANNVELVSTQIKLIKAVADKKLYLKSTAGVWSLWVEGNEAAPVEDGYYLLGTHNSWAANAGSKSRVPQDEANKAEFVGVELEANAEVKIAGYVDNAAASWIGFDKVTGGNDLVQEGAGGNIIIKAAGTYNFFVQNDGDKLFITKDDTPVPAATYTAFIGETPLAISEIAPEELDGPTCTRKFKITLDEVAAGTVITFKRNGTEINPGASGEGNNLTVNGAGKLEIVTGGKGIEVYLKCYQDGGHDTWATQPVADDVAAVRLFVANYITAHEAEPYDGMTDEQKIAACGSKYDAAKAAYDALTPEQKALFDTDAEFAHARSVLAIWQSVKNGNSSLLSSPKLIGSNAAAIAVIAVVTAGALVAGAMIYFSRKRKLSK